MGKPIYLCSVMFARAPVFELCFFVSVEPFCGLRPYPLTPSLRINATQGLCGPTRRACGRGNPRV